MRLASYVPGELIPCAFVWLDPGITPCCKKSAILVVGLPLRPLEADSDYSFSHWTLVGV